MGYRGELQGSVQTGYFDHPLYGYPGQRATIGDPVLEDGYPVQGSAGLAVGIGIARGDVVASPIPANTGFGSQSSPYRARAFASGDDAADFLGISVRDEAMRNNEDGVPFWAEFEMMPVMRQGRIFVTTYDAVQPGEDVWMWISDASATAANRHGNPIGSFRNSRPPATAAAGTGTRADSIQIAHARWYVAAPADSVGIIELNYPGA